MNDHLCLFLSEPEVFEAFENGASCVLRHVFASNAAVHHSLLPRLSPGLARQTTEPRSVRGKRVSEDPEKCRGDAPHTLILY